MPGAGRPAIGECCVRVARRAITSFRKSRLGYRKIVGLDDIIIKLPREIFVRTLTIFIDYDNVESVLKSAGPVSLVKLLIPSVPPYVLLKYDSVRARLYGGWRCQGLLTTSAQRLVPDIRDQSPTVIRNFSSSGKALRLMVELAEGPLGTSIIFEETLARDRSVRKFRARRKPWEECVSQDANCGLAYAAAFTHDHLCSIQGCKIRLKNVLVCDEQKMVDTLIVADLAHEALVLRASDLVMVSSDVDMWPGVILAARAGCNVIHIHTKAGWRTQRHLMKTLVSSSVLSYQQFSIR